MLTCEGFVRDQRGPLSCFEFYHPKNKWVLLIIPEQGTSVDELRAAVEFCTKVRFAPSVTSTQLTPQAKPTVGAKIKKGAIAVLKTPWVATNFVIGTLEKVPSLLLISG